ncbi:NAD(P)-binding protein [Annulohypoxylon maeteangense]|uniref:NAD(P)-binding protein n=1 Tax=Annulohypoxylon maeteangense TaxID=1927788 RepID=UPI002008AD34|nr:NAD(P)-binding protein [Annulohypoxylon maeteangense]KAI0887706.1 NAD(P)-binding protein [Annulohypoxylon maeteangense]
MSQHLEHRAAFETHLIGFFYRQWLMYQKPWPKGTNLSGQTAIVTGSNSGLGFQAARQLCQLGLTNLIVAVRSQTRGDTAADKLRKEFPNSSVSVWLLDMASYDSIKAFAKRCETLPRIDITILNAGIRTDVFRPHAVTNHEIVFQINYLSTVLLAILLLPVLKAKKPTSPGATPPRLSLVTSDTAYWAPPFKSPGPVLVQCDESENYKPMAAYPRSKLLQQFFVSKLAEYVDPNDVIINLSNPGLCGGTEFGADAKMGLFGRTMFTIFQGINGRSVSAGTNAILDAVVARGKETHGNYMSDWTIQPFPSCYYTKEGQILKERIWEETLEEFNFAGASKIIQDMKR